MTASIIVLRPRGRLALLAAAVLTLPACAQPIAKTTAVKTPIAVSVVTLHAGDVALTEELVGRVNPVGAAEVRPQVDGMIQAQLFAEGADVRAGQALYRIDPAPYRAAVAQAEATLAGAQASAQAASAQAARYRSISDADALSQAQVDQVNTSAKQAEAAEKSALASLDTARINLARTQVLAPISGRIGRSLILPGALVSARQPAALAAITETDPVNVDVEEPAEDLLALKRAQAGVRLPRQQAPARLTLPDGSAYALPGKIAFTETSVNPDTGAAILRARFPNPDDLLMPGMFVRVAIPAGVARQAVLAPQQGVARDAKGDPTALVIDDKNRVVQRDLHVAKAIGSRWVVTSGLQDGDRLIVEGADRITPGAIVRPVAVRLDAVS